MIDVLIRNKTIHSVIFYIEQNHRVKVNLQIIAKQNEFTLYDYDFRKNQNIPNKLGAWKSKKGFRQKLFKVIMRNL